MQLVKFEPSISYVNGREFTKCASPQLAEVIKLFFITLK